MHDSLSYHLESGVAHTTLNRPEKMNALNLDLFDTLVETGGTIKNDHRAQVVVIGRRGYTLYLSKIQAKHYGN